jgi:hypothetical protein
MALNTAIDFVVKRLAACPHCPPINPKKSKERRENSSNGILKPLSTVDGRRIIKIRFSLDLQSIESNKTYIVSN